MKTKSSPFPAPELSEADIQKQAYHLWIDGGCLEGGEVDNWLAARELLRHQPGHAHSSVPRGAHLRTNSTAEARP